MLNVNDSLKYLNKIIVIAIITLIPIKHKAKKQFIKPTAQLKRCIPYCRLFNIFFRSAFMQGREVALLRLSYQGI